MDKKKTNELKKFDKRKKRKWNGVILQRCYRCKGFLKISPTDDFLFYSKHDDEVKVICAKCGSYNPRII